MLTIRLLGGASLEGPDGPLTGRAAQRKPLALLAILAADRARAVGRDRLMLLLAPELDTERARHLLRDTTYALRAALGQEAVVGAGDELRLDRSQVRCDLWEFEAALEGGDLAAAVAGYAGTFLDGFHLKDSPEFDTWASAERERIATRHREALARRAATHASLIAAELGSPPDQQVEALANRLRRGPSAEAPPVATTPPPLPPVLWAALARWNSGDQLGADSIAVVIESRGDRLAPHDNAIMRSLRAWAQGDWTAAYDAAVRGLRPAPGSGMAGAQVATEARQLNRLDEARRGLETLDPDRGELAGWVFYWNELADVHHLRGDRRAERRSADYRGSGARTGPTA